MLRKLPLSLTRASELLCLLPLLPWLFTQGALWRQATAGLPLAGGISYWPIKAKGCGSSLSWQAIYRAVRRPGVGTVATTWQRLLKKWRGLTQMQIQKQKPRNNKSLLWLKARAPLVNPRTKKVRRSDYPTHAPLPLLHQSPIQDPYPALIWHKTPP